MYPDFHFSRKIFLCCRRNSRWVASLKSFPARGCARGARPPLTLSFSHAAPALSSEVFAAGSSSASPRLAQTHSAGRNKLLTGGCCSGGARNAPTSTAKQPRRAVTLGAAARRLRTPAQVTTARRGDPAAGWVCDGAS